MLKLPSRCSSCHDESETCIYRQCTNEILCAPCRRDPANRIICRYQLLRKTSLSANDLASLDGFTIVNPKNPKFARVRAYKLNDALALLVKRGLDVPDL